MHRTMVDAAFGGALVDKTPIVARDLIVNMAMNAHEPYYQPEELRSCSLLVQTSKEWRIE